MFVKPTSLGAALFAAATRQASGGNSLLARNIRSKVQTNEKRYCVVVADGVHHAVTIPKGK